MNEIPSGWIETSLESITIFTIGGDWGIDLTDTVIQDFIKVRIIRGTEYKDWQRVKANKAVVRQIKASSLEKRRLLIGDIVVEISGGGPTQPVGRTIIIDKETLKKEDIPLITANFCRLLRIHRNINPFYVNYNLVYMYSRGLFNDYQTQTTNLRNLNYTEFLNNITLTIPPFKEQKRIVEKLDKLLTQVDESKKRLEKVPVIIKRFRQAVLNAAVTGELTKDWREKEGIVEEWKEKSLRELCIKFTYGTSKKSDVKGKVPVLRMGNIQDGKIVWDDLKYSSDPDEIIKYSLKNGDVLFNRTNSPELVGKTAIYRGERPAIYAGYLIKVITGENLDPEFLNLCLNSVQAQGWCMQVKTDGVSQSNINAQKLAAYEILTPLPDEQKEIVKRVQTLFKKADEIEERYKKAKAYVDKLTQSILAKAFRGELVPQDPNDEPAEKLLEKIKLEKEKLNYDKKQKKDRRAGEPAEELLERVKEEREKTKAARNSKIKK